VVGDAVLFHGSPVGEKMAGMGRRAVVSAEETIASVPSYFVDAERACPATTFYRAVQVHGTLEEVAEQEEKAAALRALMEKLQPEGGHVPIDGAHPLYQKAIAGLLVARVRFDAIDGKAKLGQNRTAAEVTRIAELLWRRGREGDPAAVKLVLDANPRAPRPAFLAAPPGIRLDCALGADDAASAAALLEDQYWLPGMAKATIARSFLGSRARVGARDERGELVAVARAVSDGVRIAWIADVCVAPAWRGKGVARALVRLLLDHPEVRGASSVRLRTRDAQPLYERFGFVDARTLPPPSWPSTEMVLRR
jgi:nitroimidazol reductase NimA-like FMN-containing flavoprotein (pyridoxamine 5'-phosphate oxidase superfamily)/ribosomal protein S18 acetylase RimI-like enzyme